MLNMTDEVTPNHWSVSEFEEFAALKPDAEFNLVAPVHIYFNADSKFRPEAEKALRRLKSLGHPLMADRKVKEVLDSTVTPDGLVARYNALVMAIAEETVPGIEPYIDSYGAYAFREGRETCIMAGDAAGMFGSYVNAKFMRNRLLMDRTLD